MEIKLFGRSLFEFKGKGSDAWTVPSMEKVGKAHYLPDFKKMGSNDSWKGESIVEWTNVAVISDTAIKKIETKETQKLTPKRVYDLKMLHDMKFTVNMEPKYVDEQIEDFKGKLALMNDPNYNHKGFDEIGSILLRMENRKKYASARATFEKFPYTTNARIESVIKKHNYLRLGEIDQFVADMPKEAIHTMKEYNDGTNKLCEKKAVFYIIASNDDFKKTSSRRDPILLAQSPFGHFWQILGAWDKEMLFLEEL